MLEYTTLETLKAHLDIAVADTSKDALLNRLIKTVTAQFDKYLWFSLWETTYKQYLTAYGDCIITDHDNITTIDVFKKYNPSWDALLHSRIDWQIIYLEEVFNDTVYIEYKAWYTDLTEIQDVEQACIEICTLTYNDGPTSGAETNVKSKKIETLSKTFFNKDEMSGWIQMNFREVLDMHKSNIYNPLRT